MKPPAAFCILDGQCAGANVCPLSRVQAGTTVCIRQLSTGPELSWRLREMGLGERQRIKVVSRDASFICQVCNARVGLSQELADSIWVETLPAEAAPVGGS